MIFEMGGGGIGRRSVRGCLRAYGSSWIGSVGLYAYAGVLWL